MLDPSGRAGCKGKVCVASGLSLARPEGCSHAHPAPALPFQCKQKLPKGSVRFGSITPSSQFDGDQAYWRCMGCMTTKVCQNAVEKYGELASVPGYGELDAGKCLAC